MKQHRIFPWAFEALLSQVVPTDKGKAKQKGLRIQQGEVVSREGHRVSARMWSAQFLLSKAVRRGTSFLFSEISFPSSLFCKRTLSVHAV